MEKTFFKKAYRKIFILFSKKSFARIILPLSSEAIGRKIWTKYIPLNVNIKDLKGYMMFLESSNQHDKVASLVNVSNSYDHGRHGFIDIGANYGEFLGVRKFASRIESSVHVEPNPRVFPYLSQTISENFSSAAKVCALNKAVVADSQTKSVTLFVDKNYSGGGSLLPSENKKLEKVEAEAVDTLQLIRDFSHYDLILVKIDIEGYEVKLFPYLLPGLVDTGKKFAVLFETHIKDLEWAEKLDSLIQQHQLKFEVIYPKDQMMNHFTGQDLIGKQFDLMVKNF